MPENRHLTTSGHGSSTTFGHGSSTTSGHGSSSSVDNSVRIFCDICSRPVDNSRVRKKDNLYLCPDCFFSMENVGNNMMRSSITRFFSGNVL
ncbi:MAG: hypothetical protein HQK61_04450 [Desulfamplus sp.]|nr:hypothetical protein [Desulfamplus sp.]